MDTPLSSAGLAAPAKKFFSFRDLASCTQCGKCCERWGGALLACEDDLEAWRKAKREDILARVGSNGEIWIDPSTGQRELNCPFLNRHADGLAYCGINEIKPFMCRQYPGRIQLFRCIGKVRFLPDPGSLADRITLA